MHVRVLATTLHLLDCTVLQGDTASRVAALEAINQVLAVLLCTSWICLLCDTHTGTVGCSSHLFERGQRISNGWLNGLLNGWLNGAGDLTLRYQYVHSGEWSDNRSGSGSGRLAAVIPSGLHLSLP